MSFKKQLAKVVMPFGRVVRAVLGKNLEKVVDHAYYVSHIDYPYRAYEAIHYLLKHYDFGTVLDIGSGLGTHSDIFLKAGKKVTAIDFGHTEYLERMKGHPNFRGIAGNFLTYDFGGETFDLVWSSHVLEHQLDSHDFLRKTISLVKTADGGGGISNHRTTL